MNDESVRQPDHPRLLPLVAVLAALVAGLVVLVQPWNWVPSDDDWAYVLTTKTLVETGRYQLNDWATASVIPQAWLGSWLIGAVGDRFPAYLAVSLTLWGLGAVALYGLARDLTLSRIVSFVCAASFLLSPLVIRGAFSYMSDLPFTAFVIVAFFGYNRGFSRQDLSWTFLGSLATAAAILSRQVGVLILAGVAASWLFQIRAGRSDRRPVRPSAHHVAALAAPIAALAYQLHLAQTSPSWAQLYSIANLKAHLLGPWQVLAIDFVWRLAAILQHMALFLLPPAMALMGAYVAGMIRTAKQKSWPIAPELILAGVLMCVFVFIGTRETHLWMTDKIGRGSVLLPTLKWNFYVLAEIGWGLRVLLTAATLLGGAVLLAALIGHYRTGARVAIVFNGWSVIEWTTLAFLAFHLFFFQIGDEYLMDLLPWASLFMAWTARDAIQRHWKSILAALFALTLVTGLWVRGETAHRKALWTAGDYLLNQGVPFDKIGGDWAWKSYHGAFDRFIVEIDRRMIPTLNEYFIYLDRIDRDRHEYFVADGRRSVPAPRTGSVDPEPLARFDYTDAFFRKRSVGIWKVSR